MLINDNMTAVPAKAAEKPTPLFLSVKVKKEFLDNEEKTMEEVDFEIGTDKDTVVSSKQKADDVPKERIAKDPTVEIES